MYNTNLDIINKYYKHLEHFGYMNQENVNKVLAFTFIISLIEKYQKYMNIGAIEMLQNHINCLEGSSCIIPEGSGILLRDYLNADFQTDIMSQNLQFGKMIDLLPRC